MTGLFFFVSGMLFLLGAAVGSFLNVMVMRSVAGENWVKGRSRCDSCKKVLFWYDLIPLLSYLWLRGRCRQCRKPIGIQHLVVELLAGLLFVWWYWFGFIFFQLTQQPFVILQPLFWLVVGLLLLAVFLADYLHMIIPDKLVVALIALAGLYRLGLVAFGIMQPADFMKMLIAMVMATGLIFSLWLVTKGRGMGFGDVKLMIPLSLLMGWPLTLAGVFLSFTSGAVFGIILLVVGRRRLGQPIPFGPFLILGTVLSLLWGRLLIEWYISVLLGA
jgi:leader peptidase (prepilin peptidase) / N-methyltransferase